MYPCLTNPCCQFFFLRQAISCDRNCSHNITLAYKYINVAPCKLPQVCSNCCPMDGCSYNTEVEKYMAPVRGVPGNSVEG